MGEWFIERLGNDGRWEVIASESDHSVAVDQAQHYKAQDKTQRIRVSRETMDPVEIFSPDR